MKLRIGTRRSRLALAQAQEIAVRLEALGTRSELVPMDTAGDRGAPSNASAAGLKGLFVAEISRALHDGWVDVAVHSAKDMAAEDEDDLVIARDNAVVLVDPASVPFLAGSEVDFVDDLIGASFRVVNPNATASCGCGTSFSI